MPAGSFARLEKEGFVMAIDMNLPILVVDNCGAMPRITRLLLREIGFNNVDLSTSGAAALTRMQDKQYSLVLADSSIEPMTGLQLLQEIRDDSRLEGVHVIFLTADLRELSAAREAGMSSWIKKPFNAESLWQTIAEVVGEF